MNDDVSISARPCASEILQVQQLQDQAAAERRAATPPPSRPHRPTSTERV